jgi:hypothetical protein
MDAVAPHSFLPERGKTTEKLSINSNSYQHTFTKECMCTLDSILPVWSLYIQSTTPECRIARGKSPQLNF